MRYAVNVCVWRHSLLKRVICTYVDVLFRPQGVKLSV